MRAVEIRLTATDAQPTDFEFSIEEKVGESWKRQKSVAITSGSPEAERRIILEDNVRIVISARGNSNEIVYDRDQNAAMPRAAQESQLTTEERAAAEQKRQADEARTKAAGEELKKKQAVENAALAEKQASDAVDPSKALNPTTGAAKGNTALNPENDGQTSSTAVGGDAASGAGRTAETTSGAKQETTGEEQNNQGARSTKDVKKGT